MSKLVLNAELLTKLPAVTSETMIVSEQGKILGTFMPIDLAKIQLDISEEELQRREKADRQYSTAEVLAYLEKL
jgi:hypothetical protein